MTASIIAPLLLVVQGAMVTSLTLHLFDAAQMPAGSCMFAASFAPAAVPIHSSVYVPFSSMMPAAPGCVAGPRCAACRAWSGVCGAAGYRHRTPSRVTWGLAEQVGAVECALCMDVQCKMLQEPTAGC